jgi:hypothetical protein
VSVVYSCPHCGKAIGGWEVACPHCGKAITPAFAAPQFAPPHPQAASPGDTVGRQILKVLLAIWAVAYPVLSCGPMLLANGSGSAGGLGLLVGGVLLLPWLVGIVVLGVLVAIVK